MKLVYSREKREKGRKERRKEGQKERRTRGKKEGKKKLITEMNHIMAK